MLARNGQWRQYADENGQIYLHNAATGETRWLWEKYTDHTTKRDYYHNLLTGETRWAEELHRAEQPVRAVAENKAERRTEPLPSQQVRRMDPMPVQQPPQQHPRQQLQPPQPQAQPQRRNEHAPTHPQQPHPQQHQPSPVQPSRGTEQVPSYPLPRRRSPDRRNEPQAPREDKDEVREIDPSGRVILYNTRTRTSRYADAQPEVTVQSKTRFSPAAAFPADDRASTFGATKPNSDDKASGVAAETAGAGKRRRPSSRGSDEDRGSRSSTPSSERRSSFAREPETKAAQSSRRSGPGSDGISKRDGRYYCEPCNRWLKDYMAMSSHTKGKRHPAEVARWRSHVRKKDDPLDFSLSQSIKRSRGAEAAAVTAPWNDAGSSDRTTDAGGGDPVLDHKAGSSPAPERGRHRGGAKDNGVGAPHGGIHDSSSFVDAVLGGNYASALKEWIVRSRRSARSEAQKGFVDMELEYRISRAVQTGKVWSVEWETVQEAKGDYYAHRASSSASTGRRRAEGKANAERARSSNDVVASGNAHQAKGKRTASRPYHDLSDGVLPVVTDGAPTSEAGRSLFRSMQDERLAAAFRRCKEVWSRTLIFGGEETQGVIVGKSRALEKEFLRMNNFEADPDEVRPLEVLEMSLDHILRKYRESAADYTFLVKQFKSMRQDLLVQNIRNDFTVRMYEEHARIALASRDVGELNQCLTQLRELYTTVRSESRYEFLAYSLLYEVYSSFVSAKNRRNITKMLKEFSREDVKNPLLAYALRCRTVLVRNEYWKLPKLREEAPEPVAKEFNAMLDLVRDPILSKAVLIMAKSYRVDLSVDIVADRLGLFPVDKVCLPFLAQVDAVLGDGENGKRVMLCKESVSRIKVLKPVGITAMGGS